MLLRCSSMGLVMVRAQAETLAEANWARCLGALYSVRVGKC